MGDVAANNSTPASLLKLSARAPRLRRPEHAYSTSLKRSVSMMRFLRAAAGAEAPVRRRVMNWSHFIFEGEEADCSVDDETIKKKTVHHQQAIEAYDWIPKSDIWML